MVRIIFWILNSYETSATIRLLALNFSEVTLILWLHEVQRDSRAEQVRFDHFKLKLLAILIDTFILQYVAIFLFPTQLMETLQLTLCAAKAVFKYKKVSVYPWCTGILRRALDTPGVYCRYTEYDTPGVYCRYTGYDTPSIYCRYTEYDTPGVYCRYTGYDTLVYTADIRDTIPLVYTADIRNTIPLVYTVDIRDTIP